MNTLFFGSVFRHLLTGIGGAFVARGLGSASEWEAIAGGITAVVGVVLSFVNKKRLTK